MGKSISNIALKEFDAKVYDFKKELIRELLSRCTNEQVDFFNRMYGSIDDIPEEKMRHAYSQCKTTVHKNRDHYE
jgi:hypothetical protein